mmetsp:Transcript_5807/g.10439  ORF Transcript_5807/g.10439 Transcript_5807/m.10439 type:complete len:236 (-) Transcript_5807:464-1171(-)
MDVFRILPLGSTTIPHQSQHGHVSRRSHASNHLQLPEQIHGPIIPDHLCWSGYGIHRACIHHIAGGPELAHSGGVSYFRHDEFHHCDANLPVPRIQDNCGFRWRNKEGEEHRCKRQGEDKGARNQEDAVVYNSTICIYPYKKKKINHHMLCFAPIFCAQLSLAFLVFGVFLKCFHNQFLQPSHETALGFLGRCVLIRHRLETEKSSMDIQQGLKFLIIITHKEWYRHGRLITFLF